MLLDYHSYYGGETPAPSPHGSLIYEWYYQQKPPRPRPRPAPKPVPVRVPVPAVVLGMDVQLPGVVGHGHGRVRMRTTSKAALQLAALARGLVRAVATADVETMPPQMQAAVRVAHRAHLLHDVPVPVAEGTAELRVLAAAAAAIPDFEVSATAQARISALARADLLRPGMLAALQSEDPQAGWSDEVLLLAAAELLLDEDDEDED